MARTPRFHVNDTLPKWGALVKSWATDLDYVSLTDEINDSNVFSKHPPRSEHKNSTRSQAEKDLLTGAAGQPARLGVHDPIGPADAWALPPPLGEITYKENGTTKTLPLPKAWFLNVQEFYDHVKAAHIDVHIPGYNPASGQAPLGVQNVIVVQGDDTTMIFRLPPRATLQGSEDDLLLGENYIMEDFYGTLYTPWINAITTAAALEAAKPGATAANVLAAVESSATQVLSKGPDFPDPLTRKHALMKLHANRIGEYTLNNCS